MIELDWEDVSGRNDPRQKYRIYRVHPSNGRKPQLLSTCATEEAVGLAVCEHGREGDLVDSALGIVEVLWDEAGETMVGSRWLVKPWVPSEWSQLSGKSAVCPVCSLHIRLTDDKRFFKHKDVDDWCAGSGEPVEFA